MAWDATVNIKGPIYEYEVDKSIPKVRKALVALLSKSGRFPNLLIAKMKRARTERQMNVVLEEVYDFADANRIWLGI